MNEDLNKMEEIRQNDEKPIDKEPEKIDIPVAFTIITGNTSTPPTFCASIAKFAMIKPEKWPILTTRLNDLIRSLDDTEN